MMGILYLYEIPKINGIGEKTLQNIVDNTEYTVHTPIKHTDYKKLANVKGISKTIIIKIYKYAGVYLDKRQIETIDEIKTKGTIFGMKENKSSKSKIKIISKKSFSFDELSSFAQERAMYMYGQGEGCWDFDEAEQRRYKAMFKPILEKEGFPTNISFIFTEYGDFYTVKINGEGNPDKIKEMEKHLSFKTQEELDYEGTPESAKEFFDFYNFKFDENGNMIKADIERPKDIEMMKIRGIEL